MLDVTKSLPDDPTELPAFTGLLLAEVKSQAMLIEKLRHQLAGHRAHRFGASSETAEQLQLALELCEIAIAALTAKLRLPGGCARRQTQARADPGPYSARRGRIDNRRYGLRTVRRQTAPVGRGCDRRSGIRPRPLAIVLRPMADNGSTS